MEKTETKYVKRTQNDYSMSFKLSLVQEYETSQISFEALKRKYGIQGDSTIRRWIEKYGNRVKTNSHHQFRKHKNLVENMEAIRLEEIWFSDITYIEYKNRHMYLS